MPGVGGGVVRSVSGGELSASPVCTFKWCMCRACCFPLLICAVVSTLINLIDRYHIALGAPQYKLWLVNVWRSPMGVGGWIVSGELPGK